MQFKVAVLGDSGVGKSSLAASWCLNGEFVLERPPTLGAAFLQRPSKGGRAVLQIWDTAGQERFKSILPNYYKNSDALIVVFDATSVESVDVAESWIRTLRSGGARGEEKEALIVLCSAKNDLAPLPANAIGRALAGDAGGLKLFYTSAKTGAGVSELFEYVAETLLSARAAASGVDGRGDVVKLGSQDGSTEGSWTCWKC